MKLQPRSEKSRKSDHDRGKGTRGSGEGKSLAGVASGFMLLKPLCTTSNAGHRGMGSQRSRSPEKTKHITKLFRRGNDNKISLRQAGGHLPS